MLRKKFEMNSRCDNQFERSGNHHQILCRTFVFDVIEVMHDDKEQIQCTYYIKKKKFTRTVFTPRIILSQAGDKFIAAVQLSLS